MPLTPSATYVFDLGYYDHGFWRGIRRGWLLHVTRFKSNTRLGVVAQNVVQGSPILSDRIDRLPAWHAVATTRCRNRSANSRWRS
jgi:hypothetical protein